MQIDWLTVAAQIVNFLVLVWLLQRFLYRPITDAMARRDPARIADCAALCELVHPQPGLPAGLDSPIDEQGRNLMDCALQKVSACYAGTASEEAKSTPTWSTVLPACLQQLGL